jgi:hypothetical protein
VSVAPGSLGGPLPAVVPSPKSQLKRSVVPSGSEEALASKSTACGAVPLVDAAVRRATGGRLPPTAVAVGTGTAVATAVGCAPVVGRAVAGGLVSLDPGVATGVGIGPPLATVISAGTAGPEPGSGGVHAGTALQVPPAKR